MPTSYIMKGIRSIGLLSRRGMEKSGNMLFMSGEIMFAVKKALRIGNADLSA